MHHVIRTEGHDNTTVKVLQNTGLFQEPCVLSSAFFQNIYICKDKESVIPVPFRLLWGSEEVIVSEGGGVGGGGGGVFCQAVLCLHSPRLPLAARSRRLSQD